MAPAMSEDMMGTVLIGCVVVVITSLLLLTMMKKKAPVALNAEEYIPFKLIDRVELSHDTRRYRFALQSPKHVLGLPIGQHISLTFTGSDGKKVMRSYTPVSSDDEIGYVDFVIKTYFPNVHPKFPEGGKMSHYLEQLKLGAAVAMRGPKGSLTYKGNGLFEIARRGEKKVTKIGMVAGGTGITPMLQIINAILKEKSGVEMSLLFANQTPEDILLRDMIESFATSYPGANFKFHYTVDRDAPADWKYSTGFINADMCKANLPAPGSGVLLLMCGPPPMLEYACKPAFQKLGFKEDDWFTF